MRTQLEQNQEHLIENIEFKIQQLRTQRALIEHAIGKQRTCSIDSADYIQIADLGKCDGKLQALAEAYNRKKSLEINSRKLGTPQCKQQLQSVVDKKRKRLQQQTERKKIIEQELQRTKQFLSKKQKIKKGVVQRQRLTYQTLLHEQQHKLTQYEQCLNKKHISKLDRQFLIDQTFLVLCQGNRLLQKSYLQEFLWSNPQFCDIFHIGRSEIARDLQVFETKIQNFLDEREFNEYIKMVDLVNCKLKHPPNKKKTLDNIRKQEVQKQKQDQGSVEGECNKDLKNWRVQRKYESFLRQQFKSIDRFGEGIVQHQKYVTILGKYSQKHDTADISRSKIEQFIEFLREQKANLNSTYYKELESQFISYGSLQKMFKTFIGVHCKQGSGRAMQPDHQEAEITGQLGQNQAFQSIYDEADKISSQKESQMGKQHNQISDNLEKYGWAPTDALNKQGRNLEDYDQQFAKLSQKFGCQIEWDNFEHHQADFKSLQAFIKSQQKDRKDK